MKTKYISIAEYVTKVNPLDFRFNRTNPEKQITPQAINYRIKKGMELPSVISYKRIGKVFILEVDKNF